MSQPPAWDWERAREVTPVLLRAAEITVKATALGTAVALPLGVLWAVARRSSRRAVAWPAHALVEFVRSTPLLVQLYVWYYALPPALGISFSPMQAGVLAIGLHYSTYTSEVYRSGIDGVARGQWEAARVLGFGRRDTWLRIVLPQAVPPVIPALGNYVVAMFKETPLLSAVTVVELLQRGKILGDQGFRYLEPITIVGVLFLVVSLLAAGLIRVAERRLALEGAAR